MYSYFVFFWKIFLKIKYFENHFSILEIDEIFGPNYTHPTLGGGGILFTHNVLKKMSFDQTYISTYCNNIWFVK